MLAGLLSCTIVLRHRKVTLNKSQALWNINVNVPARGLKEILMLFEDEGAATKFGRKTESFYNPKIEKVGLADEGVPNRLNSQGMRVYQQWDEVGKYFASGPSAKRHPGVAAVV